jgi:hypothetical protein
MRPKAWNILILHVLQSKYRTTFRLLQKKCRHVFLSVTHTPETQQAHYQKLSSGKRKFFVRGTQGVFRAVQRKMRVFILLAMSVLYPASCLIYFPMIDHGENGSVHGMVCMTDYDVRDKH